MSVYIYIYRVSSRIFVKGEQKQQMSMGGGAARTTVILWHLHEAQAYGSMVLSHPLHLPPLVFKARHLRFSAFCTFHLYRFALAGIVPLGLGLVVEVI